MTDIGTVTDTDSQHKQRANSRNARLKQLTAEIKAEEADLKRRADEGDEHAKWLRSAPAALPEERAKSELRWRAAETAAWCGGCGRDLNPMEPIWHDRGICGRCCARTWREWCQQQCESCGRTVHYSRRSKHPACCEQHRLRAQADRRRDDRTTARSGRHCATCSDHFTPPRADGRYCSPKCRQKAYRTRKNP